MKPQRIQLKRVKGWKMPPNTVKVARPCKFGNPYVIGMRHPADQSRRMTRDDVIERFREKVLPHWDVEELRGKNLACFCALDEPCHADLLLEKANQ